MKKYNSIILRGALTNKKSSFTFRPWETRTFTEVDTSEISLFRIRVENLKARRFRVLPIKYWMSDIKRFQTDKKIGTAALFTFNITNDYILNNFMYNESLNIKYLGVTFNILKKIIRYLTAKKVNIILSNIISLKLVQFLVNYNAKFFLPNLNIASPTLNSQNLYFNAYSKIPIDVNSSLILSCNPRLFSPTFNTFLFQNQDTLNLISLGGFSINQYHEELPSSEYTIMKLLHAKLDGLSIKVVTNQDDYKFSNIGVDVIKLAPIFLQSNDDIYEVVNKELDNSMDLDLSICNKSYHNPFLTTHSGVLSYNSSIYLPAHTNFDHYLLSKIDGKFLNRILVLLFLVSPRKISWYYNEASIYVKKTKRYFQYKQFINC